LKAKALALLAQREHSRDELRRKLAAYLQRQQMRAQRARDALQAPASDEAGSRDERDFDDPATIKHRGLAGSRQDPPIEDAASPVAERGQDEAGLGDLGAKRTPLRGNRPEPRLLPPLATLAKRDEDSDDAASPGTAATAAEIEPLLDWLTTHDWLNETRFIETRVHARASRFGNLRIRHELAQHGVEPDADTLAELKSSEIARARAVWAKRFGQPAVDAAARAKQMRFLAARGFSAEVVRRVTGGRADDD
jgi:regulatory protein